jgi:hypothetical protein
MPRRPGITLVIGAVTIGLVAGDLTVAAVRQGSAGKAAAVVVTAKPLSARISQQAYDVAPPFVTIIGGITSQYAPCQLSEVRATAQLTRTGDARSGVAVMRGTHCSLDVSTTPTLLAASGQALPVPVVPAADRYSSAGYDFPFGNSGREALGFTWRGSWCGQPAAAVQLHINGGEIRIPLSGPQPRCDGTSSAELIPGVLGSGQQPISAVQGPPPEWGSLITAVTAAQFISDTHLGVLDVVLLNRTSRPIALTPTPTYLVGLMDTNGEGTAGIAERPLPRRLAGKVVPPHRWIEFSLPAIRFDDPGIYPRNGVLRVDFSFAGAPDAATYTTLRCHRTTDRFGGSPRCDSPLRPVRKL